MASTTDLITGVRDGTARPVATTVTASRSAGGTTLTVAATTGWDTTTKVHFQTYTTDASGAKNTSSAADWSGIVSGTTITNLTLTAGTDNGNAIGDIVECMPTAAWADELAQGLLLEHEADGTHDNTKVAMLAGAQTITGTKTFSATPVVPDGSWTAAKLDSSAIGHGFLEIKRATLSSAGDTLSVTSIPARTYLKVLIKGVATGGTLDTVLRVNADSAGNYTVRYAIQFGAGTTATAQTSILLDASTIASGGTLYSVMDIQNIAAQEKLFSFVTTSNETLGTGNAPTVINGTAKWVNTSAQINRIDVINSGTGDFAIGSEIIVFGKD